ncbi:unnamed protein product [Cyprideis torosa]|uniref:Uncharacterized protein n=1 Tax=Cyprideis torosa TaxID=163714 RepID=A0A7R8WLP8_9CRUS|nr:unnamed protein product [Cyprideis torosa]CAG0902692.1 unnamed protein product [Cyprideis torosa]
MFGLGRDPDLPQVTLWRDFEEPVRLPTVQPGDLRSVYLGYTWLRMEGISFHPGELSLIVSDPSPRAHATASGLNDGNNERSTSGEEHAFEVVHVHRNPERVRFEDEEDDVEGDEREVEGDENEVEEDENEVEGDESEVEGDESEVEGDESEVEGDESEVEGDENEVEGDESEVEGDESEVEGDESEVEGDESEVEGDESEVEGDENEVEGDESEVEGDESEVEGDESEVEGDESEVEGDENEVEGDERSEVQQNVIDGGPPCDERITWLHVFSFLPGFHPVVKVLLAHEADPNSVATPYELTPLHIAATPETARLLLEYKAKVDVKDRNGCTPLLLATLNGRHSVVEVLLAHGADPNITNKEETSPLHQAKLAETAELLIRKGAVVNAKDKHGKTPLFVATGSGHHSVVEVLLAKGADLNIANHFGTSPLHQARSKETAELLIRNGAVVNAKDEDGETPLFVATEEKLHSVAEVLLAQEADPNIVDEDGTSPLHQAKSAETAELLIVKGAEVNVKDKRGKTPLFVAIEKNHHSVVKVLLAKGANPNIANHFGTSPLHQAKSAETAELLIAKGAEVNAKDRRGKTPLFVATEVKLHTVVEVLLANEADPNIGNEDKTSPLHKAKTAETARLLLEKGANIDCIDAEGRTALHLCCRRGREEVVKQVLSMGASCDIRDQKGQTACEIAIARGYGHIVSHFPNHIASGLSSKESRFDQEFDVLSKLGAGSFGEVYKVKKKGTEELYAIKEIPLTGNREEILRTFREVRAAVELRRSGSTVKCYDAWIEQELDDEQEDGLSCAEEESKGSEASWICFQEEETSGTSPEGNQLQPMNQLPKTNSGTGDMQEAGRGDTVSTDASKLKYTLYLQMELMDLSLREFLKTRNQDYIEKNLRRLTQEDRRTALKIFSDLSWAVYSIHKYGIHRDLKPENILLPKRTDTDDEGTDEDTHDDEEKGSYSVKVGDFGLAVKHHDRVSGKPYRTANAGTPLYAAPEQFYDVPPVGAKRIRYGSKVDIYPLGLILVELLLPMTESERDELFDSNLLTTEVTIPDGVKEILNEEQRGLLVRMLSHEPERRPDAYHLEEFW